MDECGLFPGKKYNGYSSRCIRCPMANSCYDEAQADKMRTGGKE